MNYSEKATTAYYDDDSASLSETATLDSITLEKADAVEETPDTLDDLQISVPLSSLLRFTSDPERQASNLIIHNPTDRFICLTSGNFIYPAASFRDITNLMQDMDDDAVADNPKYRCACYIRVLNISSWRFAKFFLKSKGVRLHVFPPGCTRSVILKPPPPSESRRSASNFDKLPFLERKLYDVELYRDFNMADWKDGKVLEWIADETKEDVSRYGF
ncbi:hypothetical protein HRR83_000197 [Exophiala dermatitidis]|uniref:Uncharacterized protein n=2 Tax=Exophiala dermatitidis TaxID=5970 RepID=H6C8K9_EXODN|nr:uncharacterized protein HMPREF1120_08398 [Exophiala dermatitidis NIH/UT8656]KAJ4523550.1 hypothetical protein HRR73_002733 [Exophiala dermatitidis]EHY60436.1 hypothetical protein HMPREF1120_08398 [Exophiala dermatitidis NIH/UT8656]KAJ4524587.1 hypothetical protein HRR75_000177 [Exophiala dermatitidis]KAJ4527444.1 hypothetical protein HRR74_000198 [Exophiala dermatitidis]KAJ4531009.1 hypothetical protein HRR76_008695 [Exophiala dermatitidis]